MNRDSDRPQLTAALLVVVDHIADRFAERVSERIGSRVAELAEQEERTVSAPQRRSKREDSAGRTPDLPNFMTLGEAANYLNRPVETVRFWIHRLRLLDKYKIGSGRGRVMVKRADLDAMLQKVEPRGSLRDQAREFLEVSERRADVRRQRSIERREASTSRRTSATVLRLPTSSPTPAGGSA